MLEKVILKNFKANIKSYILFFVSEIMATALLFSLLALRECVLLGVKDEMVLYVLQTEFKVASAVMLAVTILILLFSMKYYMKSRISDYSMFIVLGMRKRVLFLMVLAEYSIGWVCSVCVGLLLGRGIIEVCQGILKKADVTYEILNSINGRVYKITLVTSLAVMAAAFFILLVYLDTKDLSQLLSEEERKEIRPVSRWWLIMAAIGGGLYLYAFRQYYANDAGIMYAVLQWMVSGFLILSFGGSYILETIKKVKGFYYKRVLQINQYYYRYNSSILFISMVFMIHFLVVGYMTCSIIDNLPLEKDRSQYPYDYVWIGQEKDEEYAEEFVKKEMGEYCSYPMVRLTAFANSEHIGISETTYEEITGQSIQLNDDEIYLLIEQTLDDDEEAIDKEGYKTSFQGIHTGRYQDMLWDITLYSEEFDKLYNRYQFKEIRRESLWGSISMDNWHECTIVLSDKRFQEEREKVLNEASEPNELFVFNIPEQKRAEAGKELRSYVETYGTEDEHAYFKQNVLYDIDEILEANFLRNLFNIISKGFIIAAFCISGLFIIGMKVFADVSQYREKYEYLICMGMKRKDERRNIGKEMKSMLHLSLATALFYGVTYLYVATRLGEMSAARQMYFIKCWVIIVAVYLVVQIILENILAQVLIKKVERGISDGSN